MSYAGFWRRFAAAIIDSIVLSMLTSPLMGLMMFNTVRITEDTFTGISEAQAFAMLVPIFITLMIASFIGFVLQIIYFAYMESSKYQATLGKMALGIMVTDTEGNRISFGRAAGRNVGKVISGLILMLGYIMAAFTAKKQALHDLMAGTLVIQKDAAGMIATPGTYTASQSSYRGDDQDQSAKEFVTERFDDDGRDK